MKTIILSVALFISVCANSQVSWKKMPGPNESIISLTINSSNTVYAGSYSYGVFRSSNDGLSWANISDGLGDSLIVALETSSDNTVFAGTGSHGIYQLIFGSWTDINNGLPSANVSAAGFAKAPGGGMYMMATTGKIYWWNGTVWSDITFNFPNAGRAIAISPVTGALYAGAFFSGVYKFNGVNSWTIVGGAMPNNYVTKIAVSLTDTIYAACNSNNVFRCPASGGSWTSINSGLPVFNANYIGVDAQNSLYISTSSSYGAIYRLLNGSSSWSLVSSSLITTAFNCFASSAAGKIYSGASGIYQSVNGGSQWLDINPGLDARKPLQCFHAAKNGTMFSGTRNGPWRSNDNGNTWQLCNTGIAHFSALQITSLANGNLLYHGTNGVPKGAIYRSVNNGDSWTQVAANGADAYTKIKQHLEDTVWAATRFSGTTSLQYSIDNGATWLNNPLKISAIWDIDFSKDSTIFLGSESEGVSRSDSGGKSFILGVGNTIPWYGNVIEVETDAKGFIFAGGDWYQHSLWFSKPEENGNNWTLFNDADLVFSGVQDLIFDERNNAYIAVERGGVRMAYNTDWNAATDWLPSSGSLPSTDINMLELSFDTSGYLYGTAYSSNGHDAGLFRSLYPINPAASSTYTFTGNGNWSDAANWKNGNIPPAVLSGNAMIIINPAGNGECVLDIAQQVVNGGILKVMPHKNLRITGDLIRY